MDEKLTEKQHFKQQLKQKYYYRSGGIFFGWIAFVLSFIHFGLICFPISAVLGLLNLFTHGLTIYNFYFGVRRPLLIYKRLVLTNFILLPVVIGFGFLVFILCIKVPDQVIGPRETFSFYGVKGLNRDQFTLLVCMFAAISNVAAPPCLFFAQKHYHEVKRHFDNPLAPNPLTAY